MPKVSEIYFEKSLIRFNWIMENTFESNEEKQDIIYLSETSNNNLCRNFHSQHCGAICDANTQICQGSPFYKDRSPSHHFETHGILKSSLGDATSEREGGGLFEMTGWSVDDSFQWPTTWMHSLLCSFGNEWCTQAVSLTIHQDRYGKKPCQDVICWKFIRWV